MRIRTSILLLLSFSCITGCEPGDRTADGHAVSDDSLAFRDLFTGIRQWKATRPDSAMVLVKRADQLAARIGAPWAKEYADEWRADVLIARNDTAAVAYCRELVDRRHDAGDGALGTAHMLLGEAYNALGRYADADVELAAAQELAQRAGRDQLLMNVITDRTVSLNNTGRFAETIACAQTRLSAHPDSGWTDPEVRMMSNLGSAYYRSSRPDSAIFWHRRALAHVNILNDTSAWIAGLVNLAGVHTMLGEYPPSLDLLLRAKQLAQRTHNAQREAEVGYNLVALYEPMRRVEDAYREAVRAARIADSIGLPQLRPALRAAEGILLFQMDSAQCRRTGVDYARRMEIGATAMEDAIAEVKQRNDRFTEASLEMALGDMYIIQGKLDAAAPHSLKALDIYTRVGDPMGTTLATKSLGTMYFEAGDHARAEPYCLRALEGIERYGLNEYKADVLDRLHGIYAKKGQLGKSLAMLERAKEEADRLRADSTTKAIADLEARFNYDRKQYADSLRAEQRVVAERDQRTIAELSASRNRATAYGIGAFAVLALGGGAFAWRTQRKRRDAEAARALAQAHERAAEEKRKAAEFQNAALRAQMDEHFISNTLNAVNAHLYTDDPDTASDLLARFAQWIRSMLENSQHPTVPLHDDLEALKTYLELQRLRLNGKFDFTVRVDPAIDTAKVNVPPLVVQPLLENAIEHGVGPLERGGHIALSADLRDGALVLSVEDNGVGRSSVPADAGGKRKKSSLSTRIIRDQLELLRERTGRAADLRTIDLPQGTRVEVLLPV